MIRLVLASIPLLSAVACTAPANDRYPSLLPRPIEKRGFAEVERPVPVAAADPALDAQITRQKEALAKAAAAFGSKADEAERLAARAGTAAPGSDSWIAAQVALADLDTLRSGTAGAVADIEKLAIDRAAAGQPAYPALEALMTQAQVQNQGEVERVKRITGMMRAA